MVNEGSATAFAAMMHATQSMRAAQVAEIIALLDAEASYSLDHDPSLPGVLQTKMVSAGRDGVRGIREPFLLEAAAVTGRSFGAMRERVAAARSVQTRHPRMWQCFVEGLVEWWVALKVEEACKQLPTEAALEVDRRASHWLGMNPAWTILEEVERWVLEVDAARAARRAELARRERFVHVGRFEDDHCGLFGKVSAADGVLFDQALEQIAQTLPAPELPEGVSEAEAAHFIRDQRRAAAFGMFARRAVGQDSLMDVEMIVHVPAQEPDEDGELPLAPVAYVRKWGGLLTASLPAFLDGARVVVRPVIDPNLVPDAAGHDPPVAQRIALEVRNPRSAFPYSTTPARDCNVDHTVAFDPTGRQGQTSMSNLGPLDRRAHRAKTAGHWHAEQPAPGVFLWRSPHGFEFEVTGRGTVMTWIPDVPAPPIADLPPAPPPACADAQPDHDLCVSATHLSPRRGGTTDPTGWTTSPSLPTTRPPVADSPRAATPLQLRHPGRPPRPGQRCRPLPARAVVSDAIRRPSMRGPSFRTQPVGRRCALRRCYADAQPTLSRNPAETQPTIRLTAADQGSIVGPRSPNTGTTVPWKSGRRCARPSRLSSISHADSSSRRT